MCATIHQNQAHRPSHLTSIKQRADISIIRLLTSDNLIISGLTFRFCEENGTLNLVICI